MTNASLLVTCKKHFNMILMHIHFIGSELKVLLFFSNFPFKWKLATKIKKLQELDLRLLLMSTIYIALARYPKVTLKC